MSLLNNLRMAVKVGLIAFALGMLMIGLVAYMSSRMTAIDAGYSDVIKRVDASATLIAQTAWRAETYRAAAFELLTETTDAGNARLLKVTQDAAAQVLDGLSKVKSDMPEKAAEIAQRMQTFGKAFAACKPAVEFASTTTTAEDNLKAAERMRAECNGILQDAVASQIKLVDEIVAFSRTRAQSQHDEAASEIRTAITLAAIAGLFAIGLALAIGIPPS